MKSNLKLTVSAVCAALATAFMMLGYFPYLTYAVPAMAGLFVMVPLIEIDKKYAFFTYITSALLIFFFAEPESKMLYICLFGFYPIVKAAVERLNKAPLEWIIKILIFNACAVLDYYISVKLLGVGFDDLGVIGEYGIYIFLILCNIVFVLYDIAISRVAAFYIARLHGKIKSIIK